MATPNTDCACEICDALVDVLHFCLSCKQRFCEGCKKGHLRTAFTKHHEFAPSGEGLIPLVSVVSNELCTKHQQEITFYCNTCSVVTCPVCLTELHNKHDMSWKSLVEELKKEIQEKMIEKRSQTDIEAENYSCRLTTITKNYQMQSQEQITSIEKTVEGWMKILKSEGDDLVGKIRETTSIEVQKLEERIKSLEIEKQNLLKELTDVDVKLRTSSDASILQQNQDILKSISALSIPTPSQLKPCLPALTFREASEEEVKRQLIAVDIQTTGTQTSLPTENVVSDFQEATVEMESTNEDEPSEYSHLPLSPDQIIQQQKSTKGILRDTLKTVSKIPLQESVTDIALVSDGKAWIATSKHITLVNMSGDIIVQFCHDNVVAGTSVTSTSSGDALYISRDSRIMRVNQEAYVNQFIDVTPKKINQIRISKLSGDIFVCTDHDLLRFSGSGQYKNSIKCTALALTEFSDGRILTINYKNEILCLLPTGHCSFQDTSINWSWQNRFTTALCSDTCDRIVLGNPSGKTVRVYATGESKLELIKEYHLDISYKGIFGICINDKHIWIGLCMKGIIIAEYTE